MTFAHSLSSLLFQMAAGSIEHEGSDMGVGDFVLLSEITMHAFIENLKLRWSSSLSTALASTLLILLFSRFEKGRIYTYIGEVGSLFLPIDQI